MNHKLEKAIKVFKDGGIVIFPTDTAIGIGCRLNNESSLKRLFEIRKRPKNKPVLALVDSLEMAQKYLLPISQEIKEELIRKYWPGELTIIFNCDLNKVPSIARGGGKTLGIRFPNDARLIELIRKVGSPIVAPSANFAGRETPFKFEDLDPKLVKQADYVLDENPNYKNIVSTVIDCTVNPWKILREGATKITNSKLRIQNVSLFIDTADNKNNIVGLKIDNKKYLLTKDLSLNRAQLILSMIEKILRIHKIRIKDVSQIGINIGPGSYTGLRVGLAIANALSFALKIPINGRKVGEIILPIYT
jgi:L-threonylcarbamoyladenylate synthase